MPKLQKVVKSIILHDGMGDHVDRFLLEPPAVDYAENLRVDKEGSLQKRPGFESLGTVPNNTDSTPSIIHAIGDTVYTVTKSGVQAYNGTWDETTVDGFLGTKTTLISSPNAVGVGEVQACPLTSEQGDIIGYVVAYEVARGASLEQEPSTFQYDVYVIRYSADNQFVGQWKYENRRSPRLVPSSNIAQVGVFFQNSADNILWFTRVSDQQTAPFPEVSLGITVSDYPISQHYFAGTNPVTQESTRLGLCAAGHARYQAIWVAATNRYFLFSETAAGLFGYALTPGGNIEQQRLVVSNVLFSRPQIIAVASGGLAVSLLYQTWNRSEQFAQQTIRVDRYSVLNLSEIDTFPVSQEFAFDSARVISHGSIKDSFDESGNTELVAAWHSSGWSPTSENVAQDGGPQQYSNWHDVRDRLTRTNWARVDYGTIGAAVIVGEGSVNAHRLTTNIEYYDGDYYAGLQQWLDYTPYIFPENSYDNYFNVLPCTKPVTTLLCKLDTTYGGAGATPVASLDAGQSGHVDYGCSEFALSLAQLLVINDEFYVANRVKLSAESMTYYIGSRKSQLKRAANLEARSDSLCRLHKVTPTLTNVQAAAFGDGLVFNAAIPLWFDGNYFGELGPLESPEILRVEDAYHSQTYNVLATSRGETGENVPCRHTYEPIDTDEGDNDNPRVLTPIGFRKMQVVVGYVDSQNNVHRSAPSAVNYVYDLVESDVGATGTRNAGTTGQEANEPFWGSDTTVYFTTPLSRLPSSVEYFAELYASRTSDDDLVLVAHTVIDRSPTVTPRVSSINTRINRASQGDQATLIAIERNTKGVYTAGGDLAADPWPSFAQSVVTSTRLFAIDDVNRGRVIASKLFEDYTGPEYNAELAINLGDERRLTAIGKLDDKVIVFEPGDIHVIYGDGPNNRGEGNDFAVHYIATDVGCEDQESVIETPVGLMFYSKPRGFYLLDRNMQVQFVGSGIEDTARDIDIVSATLVRDRAEVRFVFTGGPTERLGPDPDTTAIDRPPRPVFTNVPPATGGALTYNYEKNTWMVFSNYDVAAATVYQQRYTVLRNDWEVWQESRTRFDDPSGSNTTDLWTPWVKLTEQVQDFVLLWRMKVLGRYLSTLQDLGGGAYEAGDIQVEVYYDYETTPSQTKRFRVQDFAYNPFNETPRRVERLQFEIDASRGYCQAVKLRFTEIPSESMGEPISYALGRGFEISAVDFEMGARPSLPMLSHGVRK